MGIRECKGKLRDRESRWRHRTFSERWGREEGVSPSIGPSALKIVKAVIFFDYLRKYKDHFLSAKMHK